MAATYTVKQVAQILGYSTNSIYSFLKEGRIAGVRVGRGRFRIPQTELNRLLLANKSSKTKSQPEVVATPAPAPDLTDVPVEPKQRTIGIPSLFDWFLSVGMIILGASMFLFSRTYEEFSLDKLSLWLPFLRIIFIATGVGLLYADISGKLHTWWHTFFRIILIVSLTTLSFIYWARNDLDGAVFYGGLALVIIIETAARLDSAVAIAVFILYLGFSGPLLFLLIPEDIHIAAFLKTLRLPPVVLGVLLMLAEVIAVGLSWWGYVRQKLAFWLVMVVSGIILIGLSYWYAYNFYWGRSLFLLLLAFTCFLIPFWQKLSPLRGAGLKALYVSLGVVLSLFILAVATIWLIQTNMYKFASSQFQDKAVYGSQLIEATFEQTKSTLSTLADDPLFIEALQKGEKGKETVLASARNFIQSNAIFRRVLVLDKAGEVVIFYPYGSTLMKTNYSERDYFIAAATTKKPFVSDLFEANTTAQEKIIVVSVPVLDAKREVVGVLVGSIDLARLGSQLQKSANETYGEYFEVVDKTGKIIIHPNASLIGTEAPAEDLVLLGKDGQRGIGEMNGRKLSRTLEAYETVSSLSWGIAIAAPLVALMNETQTSSLVIVSLVVAILFVGALFLGSSCFTRVRIWGGDALRQDTS